MQLVPYGSLLEIAPLVSFLMPLLGFHFSVSSVALGYLCQLKDSIVLLWGVML